MENSNIGSIVNSHLHPNRISAYGAAFTVASVAALQNETTAYFAPILYGVGAISDYLDGKIAREFDLISKEGAKLDPLMDKVKNFTIGSYMIAKDYMVNPGLVAANIANFAVDIYSQRKRGPITKQLREAINAISNPSESTKDNDKTSSVRANYYGKTKTVLQNITHATYITSIVYSKQISTLLSIGSDDIIDYSKVVCTALLSVSAAFGAIGVHKRNLGNL